MRVTRQDRVTRLTVSCEVAGSRVTRLFFGQIERHRFPIGSRSHMLIPTSVVR